jgi:hypothetical protein
MASSRLETERVQLLVKLMDAMGPAVAPIVAPAPYRIVMQAAAQPKPFTVVNFGERSPTNVIPLSKQRPDGIPTLPDMIALTLKAVGDGLRPAQIIAQIRRQWWPSMPADRLYTTVHRMVQLRRVEKIGDRYRLPMPAPVPPTVNSHAEARLSQQRPR